MAGRIVAFTALGVFSGQAWARLVVPAERTTMVVVALIAVLVAWAVALAEQRPGRVARVVALVATAVVGFMAILVACGAPVSLMRIDHWGDLASEIGNGVSSLPDLRVPYRGADEWIQIVMLAGGGLLAAAAAVAAFGSRRRAPRPLAGTLLLAVLYTVPVVEVGQDTPYVSGALFALLAAALLWGDRLRLNQLAPASVLLGACVLAGMATAPRLNAQRAWIDYEHLASGLARSAAAFDWDHRYGPLNWSRSGRVMLRVTAPSSGYWKGTVLDRFDGLRWVGQARPDVTQGPDTEFARARQDWFQRIRVVAGDISSRQLYAPGDIVELHDQTLSTLPVDGGTVLAARRPLKRGDSYTADVYSPRPTVDEMRGAGSTYPLFALDHLSIALPERLGGPPTIDRRTGRVSSRRASQIIFRPWGTEGTPQRTTSAGALYSNAQKYLERSVYRREWTLAQRLRELSSSPYDLVRRVFVRVREGARYSETPPPARVPLDDFLFGDRLGYCQQFSGAMALLLRMAGVPARVASGFAPGVFDRGARQFVVRDLDAHSWVEVYFPGIGWVPFDPTPASSPASSQSSGETAVSAARGDSRDRGTGAQQNLTAGDGGSGPLSWWVVVALLTVLGSGVALTHRLRGQSREYAGAPPELAELVRALHRSGRPPPAQLTLAELEGSFRGSALAQGYLRTLREARFAGRPGRPTNEQRAALRRDLGEGLGRRGRLRALWALPPVPGQPLTRLRQRLRGRFYPE